MKNELQFLLQRLLGFKNYLFVFALYIISTLRWNRKEGDFMFFLELLKGKTGLLLDIGANLGVMSYHMAKNNPQSTIYAFEPVPHNINTIKRIIRFCSLKNVVLIEQAVGDSACGVEMVLPIWKHTRKQGLAHVLHDSIKDFNEGERFTVQQIQLDKQTYLAHKAVIGIKIDIENYEYFALKGASELISANKPVIYAELWDNENRKQCFDLLKSLGYSVNVLINNNLCLFNPAIHKNQNFFFIP
jgi:FkbM family methyltransferase